MLWCNFRMVHGTGDDECKIEITFRMSGTEPKFKFYSELSAIPRGNDSHLSFALE